MSYVSEQLLIRDSATFANFSSWASAISSAISSMGWTKTSDTGQAVWTANVVSITAASVSFPNTTYTYTLTSGPGLAVNNYIVITGMANSGNNGTFLISSLGSGTFTVSNTSGAAASSQSGTGNSAVPATSYYIYEIWQPADALQTGSTKYYFKIEYGNANSGANNPQMRFSLGTGTDGAGALTGFVIGSSTNATVPFGAALAGQGSAPTFYCDFAGDTDRIGMIFWRNNTTSSQNGAVAIERTKNADGTNSSDGVTLVVINSQNQGFQQTIVFGQGIGPNSTSAPVTIVPNGISSASQLFNNSIAMSPIFPSYGKFGNPLTVMAVLQTVDVVEGMEFTTTLYGATRTWLATKNGGLGNLSGSIWLCLALRYD